MKKYSVKAMAIGLSAITLAGAIEIPAQAEEAVDEEKKVIVDQEAEKQEISEASEDNKVIQDDLNDVSEKLDETEVKENENAADAVDNIVDDIDDLNTKNDDADEANKDFDEAIDDAKDAIGIEGEITDETADTLEKGADASKEAVDKAEEADNFDDANKAANDAEKVLDDVQESLEITDEQLADFVEKISEADKKYSAAVVATSEAQNALDDLLIQNGLAVRNEDGTVTYKNYDNYVDEDGNAVEGLDGDVKVAIENAYKALVDAENAEAEAAAKLNEGKAEMAKKIIDLRDEIATAQGNDYWKLTRKMNEYLVTFKLLDEGATNIRFDTFVVNANQTGYTNNENYVKVTYTDANGVEQTEYFNYHKEDKTVDSNNDSKDIWVDKYEKIMEKVVDTVEYTEYEKNDGDTIETLDIENVDHKNLNENEKAVLKDQFGDAVENNVTETVSTGDNKNGTVTTKTEVSTSTSYEKTTITVVDEYGTKDLDSVTATSKSGARDVIAKAFEDEKTTKVVVKFNQVKDGKLFHTSNQTYTYNSIEEFNEKFESEVENAGEWKFIKWVYDVFGVKPYSITVTQKVEDQDNVVSSHEEDAVIETVTSTIEETTVTTTTTQTGTNSKNNCFVTGYDLSAKVKSVDSKCYNSLLNSYRNSGYTISNESGYKTNDGKGTFVATKTNTDGTITTINVSYDINNDFKNAYTKVRSKVNYTETIFTTSSTTSTNTTTAVKSKTTYKADIYSKVTHEEVSHEEFTGEIVASKDIDKAYVKESDLISKFAEITDYKNYIDSKNNKKTLTSLYNELTDAIDELNDLKATTLATKDELDTLKQLKEIKDNADKARKLAEALRPAPVVEEEDDEEDEEVVEEVVDDSDDGIQTFGEDGDGNPPIYRTPAIVADNGGQVVRAAAAPRARAAAVPVADAVTIEEAQTPLAVEEVAEDTKTITDEEAPKAAEKTVRNWWWLILVALGVAGVTMYGVQKNKKKKAAIKIDK